MTNKSGRAGRWTTAIVLLLSAVYYAYLFQKKDVWTVFRGALSGRLVLYFLAIALVQWIKCTRMYLLNIDTRLTYAANMAVYTKATLVNVILPYKVGEIFRAYSYGRAIGDYVSGIARVFIDRLIDTAALLTYMTLFLILGVGSVLTPYIVLMVCFAVMAVGLLSFPSLYAFWNDYLVSKRQSPHSLSLLTLLASVERARRYVSSLLRGKAFLMYAMSLAAWGAELAGVRVLLSDPGDGAVSFGRYLMSALNGAANPHQTLNVFVSILLLVPVMLIVYAISGRKEHEIHSCGL